MRIFNQIIYDMVLHSAPLILCVLGGIFAYKANVVNIALEGMMLMGALMSTLFTMVTGSMWLGILIGIGMTLLVGLVFSFFSITLKSNFIITGLGVNLFVSAFSAFLLSFLGKANISVTNVVDVAGLQIQMPLMKYVEKIPYIGGSISSLISGHTALTYFSIICIVLVFLLMYKTKFGTYVRVVGENEEAAKSVGINPKRIKYAAILIGAVLCAVAGANMSVERMALYTNDMVAGRGFIAIAAIYCGKGEPLKSTGYAVLFGLTRSLAINLALKAGPISGLFEIVPYLMIVVVLAGVSIVESRRTRLRGFKNA